LPDNIYVDGLKILKDKAFKIRKDPTLKAKALAFPI